MNKTLKRTAALLFLLTVGFAYPNQASAFEWKSILSKLQGAKTATLDDTFLASGLREALKVGIDTTVNQLSKEDGYFRNEAVKIEPPKWMQISDRVLRTVGLGSYVDNFVLRMNRSAEAAAPHARDIFIDSIMGLSVDNAEKILKGGDTAMTEYFESTTRDQLKAKFDPVIRQSMQAHSVYGYYDRLTEQAKKITFLKNLNPPSIEGYVSDKALDGIYLVLAEQETEIRNNPQARVTELLQKTFQ